LKKILSGGNVGCPKPSSLSSANSHRFRVKLPLLLLQFKFLDHIVNGRLSFCLPRLPLPAGIQLHIDRHHVNEAPGGSERIAQLSAEGSLEFMLGHEPTIKQCLRIFRDLIPSPAAQERRQCSRNFPAVFRGASGCAVCRAGSVDAHSEVGVVFGVGFLVVADAYVSLFLRGLVLGIMFRRQFSVRHFFDNRHLFTLL
jgi:hypothetical protein